MKISKNKAKIYGDKLRLNFKIIPLDVWRYGMQVELEHGLVNPETNVTNDDLMMTAKIALAHILEFPDYYQRLYILEFKADKFWKNKRKPKLTC